MSGTKKNILYKSKFQNKTREEKNERNIQITKCTKEMDIII